MTTDREVLSRTGPSDLDINPHMNSNDPTYREAFEDWFMSEYGHLDPAPALCRAAWAGWRAAKSQSSAVIITLLSALKDAEAHLDWTGYGDGYERDCAREAKLPETIKKAIEEAETLIKEELNKT